MHRMLAIAALALLACTGCAAGLADQIVRDSIDLRSRIQKLETELQQLHMLLPEQSARIENTYSLLEEAKLSLSTIAAADERLQVMTADPLARVEQAIRELQDMARDNRDMNMRVTTARGQAADAISTTHRIQNTGMQIKAQSDIVQNMVGLLGFRTPQAPTPPPEPTPAPSDGEGASSNGSMWPWLLGGAGGALVAGGAFGWRQVRNRTRPKAAPSVNATTVYAGGPMPVPAPAPQPGPWPTPPPPAPGWPPPGVPQVQPGYPQTGYAQNGYAQNGVGYQGQVALPPAGFGVQVGLPGFQGGLWTGSPVAPGPWPHQPVPASYGTPAQGGAAFTAGPFAGRVAVTPGA